MRYEILENNQVVNTIEADESFMVANFQPGTYQLAEVQEITKTIETSTIIKRHITKLAFMNRFTDAEAIALDLASIGATVNAAAIRRYKEKISVATFIDLDRQDTRAGVLALETLGLLAEGRALIILDSTIQEEEIFKGQ